MNYDLSIIIRRLKRDVRFEFRHRTTIEDVKKDTWNASDRARETEYIKSLIKAIRVLRIEAAREASEPVAVEQTPNGGVIYWFEEVP